jgi:hypothetical protein
MAYDNNWVFGELCTARKGDIGGVTQTLCKGKLNQVPVTQACNPSYSGSRDQEGIKV